MLHLSTFYMREIGKRHTVDHDACIRQTMAFPLFTSREQKRAHACSKAQAIGMDWSRDILHQDKRWQIKSERRDEQIHTCIYERNVQCQPSFFQVGRNVRYHRLQAPQSRFLLGSLCTNEWVLSNLPPPGRAFERQ